MDLNIGKLQDFIAANYNEDINALRLACRKRNFDFDVENAITQIECRKKTEHKLKNFLECSDFFFPDSISAEQASHQAIALYHASLMGDSKEVADLTAGLGIDVLTMAGKCLQCTAIELDSEKALTLKANAKALGIKNITVINQDSISFLSENNKKFDVIYVDPARRGADKQKVFNLRDCSPDVVTHQDLINSQAKRIFIKASPLLDLTQTLKDIRNITSLHAVGVKGECKELLIEINPGYSEKNQKIRLEAVNLDNEGNILSHFTKYLSEETENNGFSIPYATKEDFQKGIFILEPSAMIMKIAPWKELCIEFNAKKFSPSSQLFLSETEPQNFPGRVTVFEKFITKKDRKSLQGLPATVISKNYPQSSSLLRETLKLKEGDRNFLYATRLGSEPIMILSTQKR